MDFSTILAIETSCDETAVAIVRDGTQVLANEIYSQIHLHAQHGGVVPEVAAREHIPQIIPLIAKALQTANIDPAQIDAIAVTYGPGLIGSLLVGVETARYLAHFWQKPLIAVNHIHGHIYSTWLDRATPAQFPVATLTVSGGHNELVLLRSHTERELHGETIDDAAGEAFDKVARMLGLAYPGGPAISRAASTGEPDQYSLPRSWLDGEWFKKEGIPANFDFSFSGLKTAVRTLIQKEQPLDQQKVADIALEFEQSVCEVLATKLVELARQNNVREIHLTGGVSANARLRDTIQNEIARRFPDSRPDFHFPAQLSYCTDNAAMIAAAAFWTGALVDPAALHATASDFAI